MTLFGLTRVMLAGCFVLRDGDPLGHVCTLIC